MLKNIPKSNVNNRQFKVYKKFYTSHGEYPVIKIYDKASVYHTSSGAFDSQSFDRTNPYSTHDSYHIYPMYQSIKHKYFTDNGLLGMFGKITNISDWSNERRFDETAFLIPISQSKYGEEIKPGSVKMYTDQVASGSLLYDDGYGNLIGERTKYQFISADFGSFGTGSLSNNGDLTKGVYLTLSDTFDTYSVKLTGGLDLMDPDMTLTLEGDTDVRTLVRWDMFTNDIGSEYITGSSDIRTQGTIQFTEPLKFLGVPIRPVYYGNVFYDDGLIAITTHDVHNDVTLEDVTTYDLEYRSTKTIHELEVLVQSSACEFNFSQNPSAVDVVLNSSYDTEITGVTNVSPDGTRRIKEILDITQVEGYTSSFDGETTGSWDDYYKMTLTDPTGSYLTTFVTTIGLYDDNNNMVAVAKLPKPIKNYPDMDVNFIVRLDL